MYVTQVQLHPNRNKDSAVIAFVDIVIDDEFVVKGLIIVEDQEGKLHVNMPCKTLKEGARMDIAHPITEDCRRYVEDRVLDAYDYYNGKEKPEDDDLKVTWPKSSG